MNRFLHKPFWLQVLALTLVLQTLAIFAGNRRLGAAELPGSKQQAPIALIGGTIHRIDRPSESANLVFADGKIVNISGDTKIPADAVRIDVTNHHIYPGLIDADSAVGLVEIDAVRATNDVSEVGLLNPNARAAVAFNPDSELLPVTRANGVLVTNVVPRGRLVAGQSTLLMLDGWNIEDMTITPNTGLHVTWPRIESGKQENERLDQLTKLFEDARVYHELRSIGKSNKETRFDIRLESLKPILDKKTRLFAHTNSLLAIRSAVAFAVKQDVRLVIVGGYDAPRAARLLKKNKVAVVVSGTQRLPNQRNAPYDEPYTVPRRLYDAGVKFCIAGEGRFGASNARNLPYHAGTAAAFGLPANEALRGITLSAAEILGVAKKIGSLTEGKDATLFVANGDILEVSTQVTHAFVRGRKVSLDSRHTRLYKKFRTKHERAN